MKCAAARSKVRSESYAVFVRSMLKAMAAFSASVNSGDASAVWSATIISSVMPSSRPASVCEWSQ